jgi:Kef-type K+ transport system membrane component KefB
MPAASLPTTSAPRGSRTDLGSPVGASVRRVAAWVLALVATSGVGWAQEPPPPSHAASPAGAPESPAAPETRGSARAAQDDVQGPPRPDAPPQEDGDAVASGIEEVAGDGTRDVPEGQDGSPPNREGEAPADEQAVPEDGLPAAGEEEQQPIVPTLPPAEPDPQVAPVLEGAKAEIEPPQVVPPSERPEAVIKTILGLLALLALAYLGGHRSILRWEERLGVSQVITAGFPFVVLGMVARGQGILGDSVLVEMSPLLRLGLGWIGFVVGFRFDARLAQGLPGGAGPLVVLSTLLPFALVVAAFSIALPWISGTGEGFDFGNPVFVRDALILGTAAAMTAPPVAGLFASRDARQVVSRILRLEEVAGVLGLALVAAFFRPHGPDISWQLPGTAWFLVTIGMGSVLGILVHAILQRPAGPAEFLVLTLGSISFAAGAAGYLHLSSVVVAFVAGVLLANFPGSYHERLREILRRLERPVYLIALVIVGAVWQVDDWRGWALMPVFMATRLVGKSLATRVATRGGALALGLEERAALAVSPIGALAIAIVVNAQLLYPGGSISLIVSAVIGGGVLTEIFVQLARRRRARLRPAVAAAAPEPTRPSP